MDYLQGITKYILPGITASMLFLFLSEGILRIRNEHISWFRRMMGFILGVYLTMVFALTVTPDYYFTIQKSGDHINWVPFRVIETMQSNPLNFWGNILLFIPFGAFLVLISNKCHKLYITLAAGAGLSLLIELLQLFTIRKTDIDDVILNTTGTLFGYFLGKTLLLFIPSLQKKIGVIEKADGHYRKKKNDAKSIAVLVLFTLSSVFIMGFSNSGNKVHAPVIPAKQDPVPSVCSSSGSPASKEIPVNIDAQNAYLWNVSTNTVLYQKGGDQKIAPASTTKMLTALTALQYCGEGDSVVVGQEIELIAKDASRAWLTPGSKLTIRQLLNALLLPSGNDAAYALAVYTGRKISGDATLSINKAISVFLAAMNKKAADIGAIHSKFTTPDGYDAEGQYTTAQDLACIANVFLESGILRDVAGSYRVSDIWLSGQKVTYCNTNELINPSSQYYYKNAIGLKTGKSGNAGCCLVSCAYINNELYICVVMGSTETGRWTDSLTLYHSMTG